VLKRTIDIVVSLAVIVVFSPVIAALAILVKATSPGPILYRGLRAGRHGVPFRMMKFRSMVVDAERRGGPSTSDDDPRLTRMGSFMRRYKLDELPQLFNVLAGDMSIVGHRPEVLSEVAEYTAEQRRILDLRPGITDWASIWNADEGRVLAGSPDPHQAYKTLIQPTKLKLQLKYRDEHSLWVDLKVVACTFLKILMRNWTPSELRAFPPAGSRRGTTA
jgi:lipopolysaccharide/colanic/teichoic acid biosynthesis glycosyltransferase